MLDIRWEPVDKKLIGEGNLKFPRFYRQKISGDIVFFIYRTRATLLKPLKGGYELNSVYSNFCECMEDEQWQPIDVVLSNTSLTFGQEVVEINGLAGIVISSHMNLGKHKILGGYKLLVLTPESSRGVSLFSGLDHRDTWNYVKLNISHTDGVSIAGYQEKP